MTERMARRWNLLSVPIDSVGRPGGTELAPGALLDAGLADAVALGERAATMTLLRDPERDPGTGLVSAAAVPELTAEVRRRTAELAAGPDPLLVLGGCCTLVPGVLAGLADAGRPPRIAYIDGHLDLYDGTTSETGEAADMPVAVALGRGPAGWEEAAGGAVLDPAGLAILGFRDLDEARGLGSILPPDLGAGTYVDTPGLRERGPASVAADVVAALAADGGGYWVHLDLDVLDESVFPATDAFVPGGLDWEELGELLAPLVGDPRCLGLNVVCLNPEKDEDGRSTEQVVALLAATIG